MSRNIVIVPRGLPTGWLDTLAEDDTLEIHTWASDEEPPSSWVEARGVLTLLTQTVDDRLLARAPHLKVVSNMAVGVDNIDVSACSSRGIAVGHTPGVLTEATADLTFALLLAAARRVLEAAADARTGRWSVWSPTGWLGSDVQDATLGIVGLGQIGTAVARRARAFGMRIVHTSRRPRPEQEAALHATQLPLLELLAHADFLSLHVPLTAETRGMIDREALRQMKRSSILINTARGGLVEPLALEEALERGWIAAAALDVTDPEPLPRDHGLFRFSNVVITPHIGSATAGTRRKMAKLACRNLMAGIHGQGLPHCVNPDVLQGRP